MTKRGHAIYLGLIGTLIVSIMMLFLDRPERTNRVRNIHATSIAVLPFVSSGREEHAMRLSDEITNDIVSALADMPELDVASRSSTEPHTNSNLDVSAIGSAVGVSRMVEGTVRVDEDHIRVTAQLIDVASDAHLWSETFERDVGDLDGVVAEIARQVAASVHD